MTAQLDAVGVTKPGVYDLPEQEYHADPVPFGSLSVSGAKKLLPPSCPAIFKWERDNPPAPKAVFDFGSAAHRLILGVGADIEIIDADSWRTNAAKAAADEARALGKTPLLRDDWIAVQAMAEAINNNPMAKALLNRDGTPEASLFWQDDETPTMLRGRLDYLPEPSNGRLLISDYKTCASANPDKFARSAADYGYHLQAAHYLDGVKRLGLSDEPAFLFIAQEKTAPYLVTVVELDSEAISVGRQKMRNAVDTYATCTETDTWPAYTDDVALVSLPRWAA